MFCRLVAVTLSASDSSLVGPGERFPSGPSSRARYGVRELLSAGTRRNGSSKFNAESYTGRHAVARDKTARDRVGKTARDRVGKTARDRVGKAVPAAAAAATLAAGAAAYGFAGNGFVATGHPRAADLSSSLELAVSLTRAAHVGAGTADSAAAAKLPVAEKPDADAPRAPGRHRVSSPRASAKPKASPTATASPAGTSATGTSRSASSASTASGTPSVSASVSPVAPPSPTRTAAATLSCNLSSGLLPENVTAIVSFLLANGYSDNAAAGIAGNIYQESKGNPESVGMGGGGLIGWTPLPSGFVTGDVAADLQTQLGQILVYNEQWASYLPALNAAASPADAAYIYVTDFERAGIPAASTREASADAVASACGI
jgi:hypothetical protein